MSKNPKVANTGIRVDAGELRRMLARPSRREFLTLVTGMALAGCGGGGSSGSSGAAVAPTPARPDPEPSAPPVSDGSTRPAVSAKLGAVVNTPLQADLASLEGFPLSYSRNSSGTYIDSRGFLTDALPDQPRFIFDNFGQPEGVLIEGGARQMLLHTESFAAPEWSRTNCLVSGNQGLASDGSSRLWLVSEGNGAGRHSMSQTLNASAESMRYTVNAVLKPIDIRFVALQMSSRSNNFYAASFDLFNETSASAYGAVEYGIDQLGDGFLHIWASFNTETGDSEPTVFLKLLGDTAEQTSFVGANRAIFLSEMWVNEGSFTTSYMPAGGSQSQRAPDLLFESGNRALRANDCSGVVAFRYNGKLGSPKPLLYSGADENNYFSVSISNQQLIMEKVVSGFPTVCVYDAAWQPGEVHVAGWRYSSVTGMELVLDGQQVAVNSSAMAKRDIDPGTKTFFGSDGESKFCNCPISNVLIFREA